MADPLCEAVPDGEALRFEASLRRGGRTGLTDERLLVVDAEAVSVRLDAVESVEIEEFDWFLGGLSVALAGFGLWATRMHLLGGLAFAAAGVASLSLTYRKRGRVTVSVGGRAKPLAFYVDDPEAFAAAMGAALDRFEAELPG